MIILKQKHRSTYLVFDLLSKLSNSFKSEKGHLKLEIRIQSFHPVALHLHFGSDQLNNMRNNKGIIY